MIDVGFIGDLHLGHPAIAKLRGFDDIDIYNEEVIKRLNSVLHKRSLLYLVGDITMENSKYYYLLDRILGRKVSIGGNHDLKQHSAELLKYVESIIGAMKYHGAIVTHIPIHTQEVHRFGFNIHAHTHLETIKAWRYQPGGYIATEYPDLNYTCVSWDQLDGIPISWNQIVEKRAKQRAEIELLIKQK